MEQSQWNGEADLERQIDDLRARVEALETRADAANNRADASEARADASEARADAAHARSEASEVRAIEDRSRITGLEERLDLNEKVIAELQMEGLLNYDQAVHLQEALRSSRMIGAAIGMIMVARKVSEVEAFAILSQASQNTNRKVRVLADDIVAKGDVSALPTA